MAKLYGKTWAREALLASVGDIGQLGGVRIATLSEGPERGVRIADVRTGDGLAFTVLVDRALDIGAAEYRGIPLAWVSPGGPASPAFYEAEGLNWLRTFPGGLMATCGLTQVGPPEEDGGEKIGLHGRISHVPAREVSHGGAWDGDDYHFWIEGKMREYSLFGHNLQLSRRISGTLGEPKILISDVVENMGYEVTPHMILYHCNMGFPLLSPDSRLRAPSSSVTPRDAIAEPGMGTHTSFESPTPHYAEQCFFHKLAPDDRDFVTIQLSNPALGLTIQIRYRQRELPEFTQWKQVGQGAYVLGLEPGNCVPEGRSAARDRGALVMLQPGERRDYQVEFEVIQETEAA